MSYLVPQEQAAQIEDDPAYAPGGDGQAVVDGSGRQIPGTNW